MGNYKTPIEELNGIVEWTFNLANCSPQQAHGYNFDDIPCTIKGENKWEKIANARVIKYLIANNKKFDGLSLNLNHSETCFILFFYDGKSGDKYASIANEIIKHLNYDKLPPEAMWHVLHYNLIKCGNINLLIEQLTKIPVATNEHYTREVRKLILDMRNTILCKIAQLFDIEVTEIDYVVKNTHKFKKIPKNSTSALTALAE